MRAVAIGGMRVVAAVWTVAVLAALAGVVWVVATGRSLEVVTTGSMAPAVPTGSLAVIEPVEVADVASGDVITYRMPGVDRLVMHRVVGVIDQGTGPFFRTRGDANESVDSRAVPASDVAGRLRWSIPLAGQVLWALRPPLGLLVLVGLPALLTAAGELVGRRNRTQRENRPGGTPWEHDHRHRPGAGLPAGASAVSGASAASGSPSPPSAWP